MNGSTSRRRSRTAGHRSIPIVLASLLAVVLIIRAAAGADDKETDASQAAERARLVARIDSRFVETWKQAGFEPAPPADDAEFIRRVFLDLTGVIPRVSEVRDFLRDPSTDKREQLIDRLLESPRHATHLANLWRNILIPGGATPENINSAAGVQNWMRAQFAENLRYDRLVADFLVVTSGNETGPALFYTTLELKPEKLAAATARIFLGLQIECAQCHHHPFDKWKQEEFWGYAAFFAQLRQPNRAGEVSPQLSIFDLSAGEVQIPGTSTIVAPAFPDGKKPRLDETGTRREQLAIWMASRDNPYLPRAAVNRVWAHLFGRGLVEPVDDIGPHNPPSHPEIMDELTTYFINSGFDLRELYRTVARTRAYQLSSAGDASAPPESFARMELKPLTGDQMFDSFERLRLASRAATDELNVATPRAEPRRQMFLVKFPPPGRSATEYQSGVLQALTLLNGQTTAELTRAQEGGITSAVDSPLFAAEERVRILFLATLARLPEPDELSQFTQHLNSGPPAPQALEDILWTLMNTAEFSFNH